MTTDPQRGKPQEHYFWPNKLGRVFLLSLEDVMGRKGLQSALNQADLRYRTFNYPPDNLDLGWSFQEMAALNQAVEEMHGPRGGRALLLRAGRAGLYHVLKDLGAVLGIAELGFGLLPLGVRLKTRLQAIADTFNKTSDQIVRLEETADHYAYHVDRCPICWGRSADQVVCHAGLGLLQEGMHWASRGKQIPVREVLCIAKGDPTCTYLIDKHP